MNSRLKSLVLLAGFAVAMSAAGHQETELYIPIGQSPGISHVKSWIGEIRALDAKQNGFQMLVGDSSKYVAFDKATRIYLQYATPGQANRQGKAADCRAGRKAEVYQDEAGTLRWVKVQMP